MTGTVNILERGQIIKELKPTELPFRLSALGQCAQLIAANGGNDFEISRPNNHKAIYLDDYWSSTLISPDPTMNTKVIFTREKRDEYGEKSEFAVVNNLE